MLCPASARAQGGVPLWTNRYDVANGSAGAAAIAVDSSGKVFVTGFSWNDTSSPRDISFATIAYSNAGDLLWENRCNGPDNLSSEPSAIALDRAGNVFVTGYSYRSDDSSESVIIKYSTSVPPPVHLDVQLLHNQLVLSWSNANFNLQSAPALTDTFTNIVGATSAFTNTLNAPQQFFRLKAD